MTGPSSSVLSPLTPRRTAADARPAMTAAETIAVIRRPDPERSAFPHCGR
ncbi:hypothetical protein IOD13_03265 [Brevibacterium casei]|nr:hypothetical protein [Brevibacterium casei]